MPSRTDEFASKAMGTAKKVKATLEGLHGVFKRLTEEHGEVTALLMRAKGTNDPEVRRELFSTIRAELLGHEKGELGEVFPIFEEHAELAPIAKHHAVEASELERKLDELSKVPCDDERWPARFDELVELVSDHVDEEEGEIFPAGERVLGKERAEEMLGRYEQAKSTTTEQAKRELQ